MGRPFKCPYCEASDNVSKGVRRTKTMGDRRILRCRKCRRKFTPKHQQPAESGEGYTRQEDGGDAIFLNAHRDVLGDALAGHLLQALSDDVPLGQRILRLFVGAGRRFAGLCGGTGASRLKAGADGAEERPQAGEIVLVALERAQLPEALAEALQERWERRVAGQGQAAGAHAVFDLPAFGLRDALQAGVQGMLDALAQQVILDPPQLAAAKDAGHGTDSFRLFAGQRVCSLWRQRVRVGCSSEPGRRKPGLQFGYNRRQKRSA